MPAPFRSSTGFNPVLSVTHQKTSVTILPFEKGQWFRRFEVPGRALSQQTAASRSFLFQT
jgi:hypothetical protein